MLYSGRRLYQYKKDDEYQSVKQHGYTQESKEAVNKKSFSLFTCKLVIRKKACL